MLQHHDRTEAVVVVRVAIVDVRIEDSRIRSVVAIAATINERIRRYSLIPIFKGLHPIKT